MRAAQLQGWHNGQEIHFELGRHSLRLLAWNLRETEPFRAVPLAAGGSRQ